MLLVDDELNVFVELDVLVAVDVPIALDVSVAVDGETDEVSDDFTESGTLEEPLSVSVFLAHPVNNNAALITLINLTLIFIFPPKPSRHNSLEFPNIIHQHPCHDRKRCAQKY